MKRQQEKLVADIVDIFYCSGMSVILRKSFAACLTGRQVLNFCFFSFKRKEGSNKKQKGIKMLTEQPILITSIKIAETTSFPKHRFIGFTGYYGQPGQKSLGVVNAETNQNEYAPVVAKGIAIVSVGEAVSAGQALEAFDDGVAVPYSSGPIEGYAMDSAASAGQLIRILLA